MRAALALGSRSGPCTITSTRLSLWRNSSFPRKSAIKSSWQQPKRWFFDQCYLGGQRNAIDSTFHRSRGEISILFKTTWVEAGPGRLDLCLWLFYVAKLSFNTSRGRDGGREAGGRYHPHKGLHWQTSSRHSDESLVGSCVTIRYNPGSLLCYLDRYRFFFLNVCIVLSRN